MPEVRLIDANSALNDLCGSQCGCRIDECGLDEPCEKARCIIRQPTIKPEVRYGRWIIDKGDMWCSECGYEDVIENGEPEDYHYCPHCGVEMNGGADND